MNKQAEIDWPTVLKMFAGGSLAGVGLGAGTSFLRYLQTLRDQTQADTSADDDVLYLTLPERQPKPLPISRSRMKRASGTAATFATGGLAGVLGTILAYNAVRVAYQKAQKKKLQQELDAAQNIYLGNLAAPPDLSKQASQFGALTKGVGTLYLALFLSALGSGVVANRMLQKQFPPIKNPNRNRPRKIVVRSPNASGGVDDNLVSDDQPVTPDALEGLVRTDMQMPKVARADGSLADLLGAVAVGRGEEVKQNIGDYGIEVALDLVKGARHNKVGRLNHNLAITWVCTDPLVSAAIQPLVAAEFQEGGGEWYVKAAAHIPVEFRDSLVGLVETSTQESRRSIYAPLLTHCKQAADMGMVTPLESIMLAKGIGSLLSNNQAPDPQAQPAPSQEKIKRRPGTSDTHTSEDSGPLDVELTDDDARRFWEQHGRTIDSAVAKA